MADYSVELIGILVALALLIFLAFRGFTLLVAAPAAGVPADDLWEAARRRRVGCRDAEAAVSRRPWADGDCRRKAGEGDAALSADGAAHTACPRRWGSTRDAPRSPAHPRYTAAGSGCTASHPAPSTPRKSR